MWNDSTEGHSFQQSIELQPLKPTQEQPFSHDVREEELFISSHHNIMHRRPAASATSSKVAASRERRASRGEKLNNGGGIRNSNGSLPYQFKQHPENNGAGAGKCLLVTLGSLLLLLIYHFCTKSSGTSDGENGNRWNLGKALHPKNSLKRIRNGNSNHHSSKDSIAADASSLVAGASMSPYTVEALNKNPYLGWQPPLVPSPLGSSFSWRDCFKADPKSDGTNQPGPWFP